MFNLEPLLDGPTLNIVLSGDVLLNDVVLFNNTMREHSKTPGISQLVLNLSRVGNMDASGLGVLVSLQTSMQRYGRRLVLLAPAPHVEQLMKEAEIEGFFPVCETEEDISEFKVRAPQQ